jgi:hypothetical protein
MGFTDRQKAAIIAAIRTKIQGPCPMCGKSDWTLFDELGSINTASLGGSVSVGGKFIPLVQLVCNHCGFVSHHAAKAIDSSLFE